MRGEIAIAHSHRGDVCNEADRSTTGKEGKVEATIVSGGGFVPLKGMIQDSNLTRLNPFDGPLCIFAL
jgi:hypothetical protein